MGDDPAADPGLEGYEDRVIDIFAGSEAEFAPGRRVRVVLHRGTQTDPAAHLLVQADVLYLVQVGREDDLVLRGQDQARDRQAHPAYLQASFTSVMAPAMVSISRFGGTVWVGYLASLSILPPE